MVLHLVPPKVNNYLDKDKQRIYIKLTPHHIGDISGKGRRYFS